jgi:hypothetical protein
VGGDGTTPLDKDGVPLLAPAWRYLITAPAEPH